LHADASLFTISLIFPLALGLRVVPVVWPDKPRRPYRSQRVDWHSG
jgi:hypothetical protein